MKTLNSIILVIASLAIMVSCTCNGSKKTSALTKEQLIDKKFEPYSNDYSGDLFYGRWLSDEGEKCYEFLPNKYNDIVCSFGHHHELPKQILLIYSQNSSGDFTLTDIFEAYVGNSANFSDPLLSVTGLSGSESIDYISYCEIAWGYGDEMMCLDASTQFIQDVPFDWDTHSYFISDWGKRYYKDSTLAFPSATQEEINAFLKSLWDSYCGSDDN